MKDECSEFIRCKPLIRFQHLALQPLQEAIATGKQIGPPWDEVAANDWSLGDQPQMSEESLVSIANDISRSLRQLITCREALVEESRRRRQILLYEKAELLLIAADAVGYKFYERMNKFCNHDLMKSSLAETHKKPPRLIADLKRRRAKHTHNVDVKLVDSSAELVLFSLLARVKKKDREQARKEILAENRRVYRKRIAEQVIRLKQTEDAAFEWVNAVFTATEHQWTDFLKNRSQ